ncbi:MAG: hypothetical protein WBC05_06060, partial [Sedimentisphaerales bacterium]
TTSGNIVLTGTTTAAADDVTMNSIGSINGAGLVTTAVVDLNAATGIGNTTTLELDVANLEADTATGGITLTEASGLASADVTTTGAASHINVTTGNGGTAWTDVDTSGVGSNIVLTSGTGTTTLTDVDTVNGDITLTSTTGNIALADLDEVVSAGPGGNVILSAAGSITVAADSVNTEIKTSGSVTLTGAAIGGTNPLDIEDATSLAINDLDGTTDDHIQIREQTATSTIASTSITVADNVSGNIDITYSNGDSIDINNGHVLNNIDLDQGASSFSYTATTGDVSVEAINTGTENISITATAGAINEEGAGDAGVDIAGNALTLTARDEIGGAGELDIETTVASLDASSTTAGNIVITETDGIILTDVDTADGAVTISAGGMITATDVVAGDAGDDERHDVRMTTTSGGMVLTSVVADDDIVCSADAGDLDVRNSLGAAGHGGVKLVADDGKIYSSGDTLNVDITGYSDGAARTGVDLPFGNGKAAIVLRSSEDLILGPSAILTAKGSYSPIADDRSSVGFDTSPSAGGDLIDVAIYLGNYWPALSPTGRDIAVNSLVSISNKGTMVVDAGEKVTFGGKFNESVFNQTHRLEVVSRISNNLNEVRRYDRLPFAENPEAIRSWFNETATGYFAGAYVLRGGKTLLAEVLSLTDPVPLVPPRTFEPELRSEVEGPDTEALATLLSELGIGVQPYMTEAYAGSLSTDLRLYKAAEKLQELMPVLEDADGTRIAKLKVAVEQFFPTLDLLSEEQMDSFTQVLEGHKGDGTDFDLAGQCIFALREYVNILSTEIGWPVEKSVEFVMGRYVPKIAENDEIRIAVIQMHLQK